jgi:hypothetical protein
VTIKFIDIKLFREMPFGNFGWWQLAWCSVFLETTLYPVLGIKDSLEEIKSCDILPQSYEASRVCIYIGD